jgi:hypothetical protein
MSENQKMMLIGAIVLVAIAVVYVEKNKPQQPIAQQRPPQRQQIPPRPPKPRPQPEPEEPKVFTFDDALNSITEAELKETLTYLASQELEGRMSGKQGNIVAADYIKKRYESFGLQTMYHRFNIRRMNPGPKNETGDDFTQNIYAWIDGNDPALKDEIVVVGAHMDHIGYGPQMSRASSRREVHPGADDNASGTVGLMEIAQAFSMLKGQVRRTVVFQSYSAEEMGLIGSRYYCDNPVFPKSNPSIRSHIFMENMDMIGYLGKGRYFAGFQAGDSSIDIGSIINELNGKYSFAKQITSRGSGGSDHACFYNKKVPIAFLHTGLHAYYHTPDDTADKINFVGIEKVAKYGFELAWRVVQSDARPQFNYAGFKEMDYTHDHGHPETPFIHHYHRHGEHGHKH